METILNYEEFLYSDLISLPLPENVLKEGALKKTSREPLVAKIKFKEKKAMLNQNLNSALKDFDPSFLLKNVSLFQEEITRIIDVHNIFDELALVRSRSAKLYQSNCA
ncbi:uncharacterized protein KQ657_004593 [Scheffersomyces spartinae]|uniref:Uncharacterized protein n=1 Tax=Scheffersomyces spartinae TaxID=45513 RepID=A0A9P7VAE7_9ASCO|nr:uncharacterized protein KQ657_004593 [Scheffersomyces spartinae]KAG7194381.1 hypothetical protein KQ657_004593 [Scheffersomyces spartinae]